MANPVLASHPCDDAGSTGLTYQCLQNELKQLDDKLKELLNKVPATASELPQQFRDLWMEHLEGESLNRSNVSQLMEFQKARRNYCLYVNSIAFQGTGYGSMVLKCEIELTQSALKNEI
ncbi:MAG: lysozyme inhibitor LprI family protein [Microcystaceae cyanobacterium]